MTSRLAFPEVTMLRQLLQFCDIVFGSFPLILIEWGSFEYYISPYHEELLEFFLERFCIASSYPRWYQLKKISDAVVKSVYLLNVNGIFPTRCDVELFVMSAPGWPVVRVLKLNGSGGFSWSWAIFFCTIPPLPPCRILAQPQENRIIFQYSAQSLWT